MTLRKMLFISCAFLTFAAITTACNKENTCECKTLVYGDENVPDNEKRYIPTNPKTEDDCNTLDKKDTILGISIDRTVCKKKS